MSGRVQVGLALALGILALGMALSIGGPGFTYGLDDAGAAPGDGGDSSSVDPGCYWQVGTSWVQGDCPAGKKPRNAPRCFVGTTPAQESPCPDFMLVLPGTTGDTQVPAPNPPCYDAPAVGSEDTPGVHDDWSQRPACPTWAWPGTCLRTGLRPIECPPGITPGPTPDYRQPVCLREGKDAATEQTTVWIPAKCIGHRAGTCFQENKEVACPAGVPGVVPGSPTASVGAGDSSFGGDGDLLGGTGGTTVPDRNGEGRPDTREFVTAIASLQAALTPVVTGLAGIGVLLGAAMIAIGQQAGLKIAATSATVGGVLLLGNGLIQAFSPS
jgi:hypothetical protein